MNGDIVIFLTISGTVKILTMSPYSKSIKNSSFRYGDIIIILTMPPYNGDNVKILTMFPYLLKIRLNLKNQKNRYGDFAKILTSPTTKKRGFSAPPA